MVRGLALGLVLLAGGAAQASAADVEGTWKTEKGTEITIAPCDVGFCGTLSWIVVPPEHTSQCLANRDKFGAAMLDYQNPDKSLRTRSLIGMQMMTLKPTGNPEVFEANLYDAEHGKFYDGTASVTAGGAVLRLGNGCLMGMCVVTQDWPRVANRENTPDFTCGG